jgi:hypothetical protein
MPRKCTICENPKRNQIDESLVSPGAVIRTIARQYRVSKDSLARHVKGGHIAAKIHKAQHAHEAVAGESILNRINRFHRRFEKMAKNAESWGDPNLELKVYQTQAKYLELEGKAVGAFREKIEHSGSVEMIGQMGDDEVMARARSILSSK